MPPAQATAADHEANWARVKRSTAVAPPTGNPLRHVRGRRPPIKMASHPHTNPIVMLPMSANDDFPMSELCPANRMGTG